jgi:hypothetical protein
VILIKVSRAPGESLGAKAGCLDKIPFNVYDFFAYLSSGSVVLATIDFVWKTRLLDQPQISPILGILLIILAYVSGHVVAHFSSFILRRVNTN